MSLKLQNRVDMLSKAFDQAVMDVAKLQGQVRQLERDCHSFKDDLEQLTEKFVTLDTRPPPSEQTPVPTLEPVTTGRVSKHGSVPTKRF